MIGAHLQLTLLTSMDVVQVQIVEASKSVYAAVVNNQVLVKIGTAQWDPASLDQEQYNGEWKQELVGPGFTVWALKQF